MPYSILIVDDERIIREGIAKLLPWKELDFELAGMAANGAEALSRLKEEPVDIAIIDIRMPVLSGIELVAQARKENIPTEFIILTGYEDFEYAQMAMQYDVKSFLLKPTEPHEIIDALQKVAQHISRKRESLLLADKYNESNQKLKSVMKEQYLRDCILGRVYSADEHAYYTELLEIGDKNFSAVLFRVDTASDKEQIFLARNIAEDFLGDDLFLCAIIHDMACCVIKAKKNGELWEYTRQLTDRLKQLGVTQVTASFAECWDMSRANVIYGELEACIRFRFWLPEAEIITKDDVVIIESDAQPLVFHSQTLLNCLKCGDLVAATAELDTFFESFLQITSNIEMAKSHCMRLYQDLLSILSREDSDEYTDGAGKIQQMETLFEIKEYLLAFAAYLAEQSQMRLKKKNNKQIAKMLECIEENIANEDLSLKWISNNLLYFNADYLGKLFKKEVGVSFTNYVIKRRIEIACELFQKNPQAHVYDVAVQIGFGYNTQYFSQIFKKVMGVLPSEYQKSL